MNINATMKKLQTAILQTGLAVSINRSQFYSADQKRFVPVVSLTIKVHHCYPSTGQWKDQVMEIIRTTSQIEALECMVEIYEAVRDWKRD